MEFRKIKFTIYLVSIALLLLIVVQLFWAYSSFKLSEKTFNSNVMDAMRKAVATANENVDCFTLFSKTQVKAGEGFYMIRTKKNDSTSNSAKKIIVDTIPLYSEYIDEHMPFSFSGLEFNSYGVNMEAVLRFRMLMGGAATTNEYLRSANGITLKNFRDKLSDKAPIYKKYDTLLVDSLLKMQLRSYSISDKFHFAFINSDKKEIEYLTHSSDKKKILASPLKQQLTDNRYFTHPYDLVVYFDDSTKLIFSSIRGVLILSALVIIALFISFYIFIRIVYKQRKLSELKNDFVNNMTHEFKTPLANISLVLETLSQEGFSESENSSKVLKILGQETERLRENIEKILQVASFEKEKINLTFEKLDINQGIQNAVSCFDVVASPQNIKIVCDLKAANPIIVADETHLINVIYNLVDNAIKYSIPPMSIQITTKDANEGVILIVKDNGQGIGKDAQKRIFEKFYREPNGNIHTIKGFGLGLTYVKSIIDFHHGKIHLKSQQGAGSEFEIYLPHKQ